jgi:hypothetical protein
MMFSAIQAPFIMFANGDGGSFFSGLIVDVRIYNAALSAEEIEALSQ